MQVLMDETGVPYELIPVGKGKVRLQNKKYPEISHIYKVEFIENAIKEGLLTPISEEPPKFIQEKLSLMKVQGGEL